ncbi:hypothetical protein PN36_19610 [Candidatus Thiomargarita nelsonii]|uniref:LamG domain-containing protein n=1 Tax=Candidatus Thiomargarita nelsonii TaxID=1003181 RepID=A0A4E0QU94_9GAMM|nr:hypothetical protein PN36_19610 [Candidatus Thiomargarita nelsonii]
MMIKLRCYLRTLHLIAIGLSWFSGAMADLSDGLVAYYPFSGNANDESGNENHGTVNGVSLTIDRFGSPNSAYNFDGNDYIQTPVDSNIVPLSFSVWFQADNVTGERSIVDSDVSGHWGHSLIIGYWHGDGDLDVQYHNDYIDTNHQVSIGEWYHVVVNSMPLS